MKAQRGASPWLGGALPGACWGWLLRPEDARSGEPTPTKPASHVGGAAQGQGFPARACCFCEARNFAGVFGVPGPDGKPAAALRLTLDSYRDIEAEVLADPAWPAPGPGSPGDRVFLRVATGELLGCPDVGPLAGRADLLKASRVLGRYHAIRRQIEWAAESSWGGQTWRWERRIPGHSLEFAPAEDPELLDALAEDRATGEALDFTEEEFRPLAAREEEAIMAAARVVGKASERPVALLLIGPSCAGKTTVVNKLAKLLCVDLAEAVKRDSNLISDHHRQYKAVIENGRRNGGIWLAAWGAVKSHWQKVKAELLRQACENRRDIVMFARGVKGGKRALDGIKVLRDAGHEVHVIGVYASTQDLIDRGLRRELHTGKRYNRENITDLTVIPDNFRGFAPAIGAANGQYKIVLNSNGQEPQVQLEGRCLDAQPVPKELVDEIERALSLVRPRRTRSSAFSRREGSSLKAWTTNTMLGDQVVWSRPHPDDAAPTYMGLLKALKVLADLAPRTRP